MNEERFIEACEHFRGTLRKINSQLFYRNSGPPFSVYHYTDAGGVRGILESDVIWMAGDHETRDPLELRYANKVFEDVWNESGGVDGYLTESNVNPYLGSGFGTYFVAFSENADSPHHWQNFANRGRGFSIGVDFAGGPDSWTTRKGTDVWLNFGRVVYEEKTQHELLRRVLEETSKRLSSPTAHAEDIQAIRQVIGELLPFFKHRSFREENEWRLVATRFRDHTPNFAEIQNRKQEFRAVLHAQRMSQSAHLPIKDIYVGPRAPFSSKAHLEALLSQRRKRGMGRTDIEVHHSGWADHPPSDYVL